MIIFFFVGGLIVLSFLFLGYCLCRCAANDDQVSTKAFEEMKKSSGK